MSVKVRNALLLSLAHYCSASLVCFNTRIVMNSESENLFTGHGGPMPVSRVLNAGFFGTVDDAFSSRSLHIPGSSESLDCITPNSEGLAVTESFNMEVYKTNQSFHLRSN